VPLDEHRSALEQIDRLSARLGEARDELRVREQRLSELQSDIRTLQAELRSERRETERLRDDLDVALQQLGTLRERRFELQDELERIRAQLDELQGAAIAAGRAQESVRTAESSSARSLSSVDATAAALRGGGGFNSVRRIGFQNDPRAAARLSGTAPGIGVDTSLGVPVLYDSRLDYDETLVFLSIIDPDGRRPRLRLTTQYTTDAAPLYLRTAFITIEGADPVDPLDPIVLANDAIRETDGAQLREALNVDADAGLVDRLSTMISSSRFQVTFVGMNEQHTHRPSIAERSAMSNMLFAFIDLGGIE
jgi:hypothetical protein